MTENTRAERLRKMIADEDEDNDFQGAVIASNLVPETYKAIKVFLERLHRHEVNVGDFHTGCYMCKTADDMIKEFS